MSSPSPSSQQLRFRDFELDRSTRALRRGRKQLALEPKVFECLWLLASRAGELVSMHELSSTLWPDVTVGPDALRRLIREVRKVLGDSGEGQRFVETRRRQGYIFKARMREERTVEATHERSPAWPFVGRHAELDRLRCSFDEAAQSGRVALVLGGAGVGKTALVERLREETAHRATWLHGTCIEGPGVPALWPWREILGSVPIDDGLTWCELLLQRSRGERIVLVLEDLHAADEASLRALVTLCTASRSSALLVIATCRTGPLQTAQQRCLARLAAQPHATVLELADLRVEEIRELEPVLEARGLAWASSEYLLRVSGGHALFVRLIVEGAREPGAIPETAQLVVAQRLAGLPASSRDALEAAAVLGSELALSTLARMREQTARELEAVLEPAIAAGLLARDAREPQRIAFRHTLIARSTYETLPPARRAHWHAAAFHALEETAETSAHAHHAYLAGSVLPRARVLALCNSAGQQALAAGAFERASLHLARALETAESDAHTTPLERAQLALDCARAQWSADQPVERVTASFERALGRAREAGSLELLTQAAIGFVSGDDSLFPYAFPPDYLASTEQRLLSQVLRELPPGAAEERRRISLELALLKMRIAGIDEARAASAMIAAARPTDSDALARLRWLQIKAIAEMFELQLDRCRASAEEALALCESESVEPFRLAETLLLGLGPPITIGDLQRYDVLVDRLAVCCAAASPFEIAGRNYERWALMTMIPKAARIMRATTSGRFEDTRTQLQALAAWAHESGFDQTENYQRYSAYFALDCALTAGQAHAYRSPLESMWRAGQRTYLIAFTLARIDVATGPTDVGQECFALLRAGRFLPPLGHMRFAGGYHAVINSESCALYGDADDANYLYQLLLPLERYTATLAAVHASTGSVARRLGRLASQLGDHAAAQRHYEHAIEDNRRQQAWPELALTLYDSAQSLQREGRTRQARLQLEAADRQAKALGMQLPRPTSRS